MTDMTDHGSCVSAEEYNRVYDLNKTAEKRGVEARDREWRKVAGYPKSTDPPASIIQAIREVRERIGSNAERDRIAKAVRERVERGERGGLGSYVDGHWLLSVIEEGKPDAT